MENKTSRRRSFRPLRRGTIGMVFLCCVLPQVLAQSAKLTTVGALPKAIDNYVAVEGAAGEVRQEPDKNTFLYTLRDFYGQMVEVRTADRNLELHQALRVFGIVHLERVRNLVLDERHRQRIGGISAPAVGKEFSPEGESSTEKKPSPSGNKKKSKSEQSTSGAKADEAETPWWRANAAALAGGALLLVAAIAGLSLLLRKPKQPPQPAWPGIPEPGMGGTVAVAQKSEPSKKGIDPPRDIGTTQTWGSLAIPGPSGPSTEFLHSQSTSLGSADCDITLSDPHNVISRKHATIVRDRDGTWLVDDSKNGSFVNGTKVEKRRVPLKSGDTIKIGAYTMTFKSDSDQDKDHSLDSGPPTKGVKPPTQAIPAAKPPTAMFFNAKLRLVDEGVRTTTFPLGETTTIGRNDDRNITLDYPTVSREHCSVVHLDGKFYIRNDSEHGTKLNDQTVSGEQELKSGDYIRLGEVVLEFTGP